MRIMRGAAAAVLIMFMAVPLPASAESEFREAFTDAVMVNDRREMSVLVKANLDEVPAVIEEILGELPEAPKEERVGLLYMAEAMAVMYKDFTGDVEILREVKAKSFEERVSEPVRSVLEGGVHIIDMPSGDGPLDNKFVPDNVVIKKGDTVRWTNTDEIIHVFASMPFIGRSGLYAGNVEPGDNWEYTFTEAGEYFYICFIHRGMIGKITVVDDESEAELNEEVGEVETDAPVETGAETEVETNAEIDAPAETDVEPETEIDADAEESAL